jgi:hypothetical protein
MSSGAPLSGSLDAVALLISSHDVNALRVVAELVL